MELRTRAQRKALTFFRNGTTIRRGSAPHDAAIANIVAAPRPMVRARALLGSERTPGIVVSRKLISREVLERAILEFTAKHGAPDHALFHAGGADAPIARARRLADAGQFTGTHLSKLQQLMLKCCDPASLWSPADIKIQREQAARKLEKVRPDPRYRMSSYGYSIPLSAALAGG